jgi:hypothetical protein
MWCFSVSAEDLCWRERQIFAEFHALGETASSRIERTLLLTTVGRPGGAAHGP